VDNPVFNDTSGTRLSAITWGSRIFLAAVVLLGAAVALTLQSHVSVPGLQRIVPGLGAEEVRRVPSNPPVERRSVAGSRSVAPSATSRPTTSRTIAPTAGSQESTRSRRAVAPTSAPPAVVAVPPATVRPTSEPSRVTAARPTSAPTSSASSTTRVNGQGTAKPRNPKAATPSPPNRSAPGQTRTPGPRSTNLG
jgi:hypothetical protein